MSGFYRHHVLVTLGAVAAAATIVPVLYHTVKRKLLHKKAQIQYNSSQFVLAAGAVAFQFDSAGVPKRVLLVHYKPHDQWLLAKGRKDEGEDLATTALREVHEETGYPCHLHKVPQMPTCAPFPSTPGDTTIQPHAARIAHDSTEPFMITVRPIAMGMVKLIFWYIGALEIPYVAHGAHESVATTCPGSHQFAEGFDEVRLFEIPEALERLAFEGDRDLVRTSYDILTSTPRIATS